MELNKLKDIYLVPIVMMIQVERRRESHGLNLMVFFFFFNKG